MHKYLAAAFLMVAAASASAASSDSHWFEIHSPNFVVLTDSSEKAGLHVATQFERMRAVFHAKMPAAADDPGSPVVVIALKDKKGFQALEPAGYLGKGQLDLAGLFLQTPNKNYVLLRLDADGDHPYATIYHEYTHYMLRGAAAWMPLWLNEGMAEFYQNTEIQDKRVLLGEASSDDIYYLRQNALLPIPTILQVNYSSPYYHEEQKGSMFYAESWALTHYIILTDAAAKTHRLQDYAQLLIKGQDPVAAAAQAFGDLKQLQVGLARYVQQDTFRLYQMDTPTVASETSFSVESISTPQADAIRADVLLNNSRSKEAEALLDTVLHEDPNNALAHETMGFLKFQENDIPAAKQWFGQAVQLDSGSYLAHFYYAAMSLQIGDTGHDAEIESSLRTAIKLNPSFAASYDSLAWFYLSRHEKLDEAHMLNVDAVTLDPSNINYRLNAADVLAASQDFTNAIHVLTSAEPLAKNPAETVLLESRISQIKQYQAQAARAEESARAVTQNALDGNLGHATTMTAPVPGKAQEKEEPVTGPHRVMSGVLGGVTCVYPSTIIFDVKQPGKTTSLYSNSLLDIDFTAQNVTPQGNLNPCADLDGMKARVTYVEVSNKTIVGKAVAGQILAVELSK